jgi:hypothetical protein
MSAPNRTCRGLAAGAIAIALCATGAPAAVIAAWNFNQWNPQTDFIVAADLGSGTIDLAEVSSGLASFAGTTENALPGVEAGAALSIVGQTHNSRSILIYATAGGASDLTLSFAARRTASGFSDNRVEMWNGGNWVALGGFAAGTDWPIHRFDFEAPSMLGSGEVVLRITLGGATTSSGNLRLDNMRLETRAIPAPGALSLLGASLLVARRRRRR